MHVACTGVQSHTLTRNPIVKPVTSIPVKTTCVIRDDSGVGIVESVPAIVAAIRGDGRWIAVSHLRFS